MDSTDLLTQRIIGGAMKVHTALGPGLLENVYRRCLVHELTVHGLQVATEKAVPVHYDGVVINAGLRVDLVVEDKVLVEVKSVTRMIPLFQSQVLSYLRLSGLPTGLLINFNVRHLRHGITRMVR